MKLASYLVDGHAHYGAIASNGDVIDLSTRIGRDYASLLQLIQKNGFEAARAAIASSKGADRNETSLQYLPLFSEPVTMHCIGLNYAAHAAEAGHKPPEFPRTFVKVPAAIVAHGEILEKPTLSPEFDFEGELAVVLNKTARNVAAADALDYVAGYTCFMDGSVRDYQFQRTVDQGKNFFRSSSIGPALVTPDEVGPLEKLSITTLVSGETMQHASFSTMIFSVPKLIEYMSSITELRAGDVIATGTPEGVGFSRKPPRFLRSGDTVEVIIERVGKLKNTVSG